MNSYAKIDWISFTVATAAPFVSGTDMVWADVLKALHLNTDNVLTPITNVGEWEIEQGRGVYHSARVNTESKVRLSFGDVNSDIYVEISGQSCDYVRSVGILEKIFQHENIRFSRVDLATDYETDIHVEEIISKGYKTTFKSRADWRTEQGDTTYIGSRKSERMLRVYRYHPPHPRSHLLRCEVELKGDASKLAAKRIVEVGEVQACTDALAIFQLDHHLIQTTTAVASAFRASGADKVKRGTARWFLKQVKPALLKAHKNGEFDVRGWLAQLLFSELK